MAWSGVLLIVRALVLLQLIPGILSWGKEGHYAVCKIAEVKFHNFRYWVSEIR